jgi:hypothetical protein
MKGAEFKQMLFSAVLMSVVMSFVLSLYWTFVNFNGLDHEVESGFFLITWSAAWFSSFVVACPVSLIFAPIIKYFARLMMSEN